MNKRSSVVHLDGYFDNPDGDFLIEQTAITEAGGSFFASREADDPELWKRAAEAEIILVRALRVDEAVMQKLPCCRLLIRYGIGLDKIDRQAAQKRGIEVRNIPDFCMEEMADHTLAFILYHLRGLGHFANRARSGDWSLPEKVRLNRASAGTLVTLGFGRIARLVLERARAFGFRLAAHDPFVAEDQMQEKGIDPLSLRQAFEQADVLSIHCPLTDDTRHLVNAQRLSWMKKGAILINTARGGLVDTEALVAALQEGQLGGVGLDVTEPEPLPVDHPLYDQPGVLITPHMAWYSEQAKVRLKQRVGEEAASWIMARL